MITKSRDFRPDFGNGQVSLFLWIITWLCTYVQATISENLHITRMLVFPMALLCYSISMSVHSISHLGT